VEYRSDLGCFGLPQVVYNHVLYLVLSDVPGLLVLSDDDHVCVPGRGVHRGVNEVFTGDVYGVGLESDAFHTCFVPTYIA
jgi:hypothetical protein